MARPRGALNKAEWRILRHAYPDKMIYRVSRRMFHAKKASRWLFITGYHPIHYFDNYWHAYAYAVKRGLRGDDLQVKFRGSDQWK